MASQNVTTTYIKEQKQTQSPESVPPTGSLKVTVSDTYLVITPSQAG